jgi:hypothetical protein
MGGSTPVLMIIISIKCTDDPQTASDNVLISRENMKGEIVTAGQRKKEIQNKRQMDAQTDYNKENPEREITNGKHSAASVAIGSREHGTPSLTGQSCSKATKHLETSAFLQSFNKDESFA